MEFLNFSLLIGSFILHLLPKAHCYAVYSLSILFLLLGMKSLLAAKIEHVSLYLGGKGK